MVINIETKKLTEEQKIFATENHNLIYTFLSRKNLDSDNFYDIVVFGYLRAVKKYFRNQEIWKYQFSTIAYKEMNGELLNYFDKNKSEKYVEIENSIITSNNEFDSDLLTVDIENLLTTEDFLIYQAKLNGMSIKEISKYFGITNYKTNKRLDIIKDILKKLI